MTERARALRREATPAERALWALLSRYRPPFTRQLSIENRAILDLACREAMLGIELDGSQHHEQVAYDEARTQWLKEQGWRVLRLWNSEVLGNPEGAAEHILNMATECLGGVRPKPIPSRAGRERRSRF